SVSTPLIFSSRPAKKKYGRGQGDAFCEEKTTSSSGTKLGIIVMGCLNPRSWCMRRVNWLGETNVSTAVVHFSKTCVYLHHCGVRRNFRVQRKHSGLSQSRSLFFQSTCMGHTSQCSL